MIWRVHKVPGTTIVRKKYLCVINISKLYNQAVAYPGFHFGGGGGSIFFVKVGGFACREAPYAAGGEATHLLGGFKIFIFYIKIIDNVFLCTLYLGVYWSILPRFLVNCAIWCVLEHIFRDLSLTKIYINIWIIEIWYCCALAI